MTGGLYTPSDSAGDSTNMVQMPIGVYWMGAHLWNLANMTELHLRRCGLCQVILTTCFILP